MNSAITPVCYTAQRMGARMIETLCRMGFEHNNKDGRVFRPAFADIVIYGESWAVYEIDAGRLWHFAITDLGSVKVTETLSAVLRRPVRALKRNGLYFVVELTPRQAPRLPQSCPLDLDSRPAGALVVPIGKGRGGDVWRGLADLGHTLIVGTSGSGKSTWLHAALAALFTSASPAQLQAVLIDPKRSELTPWASAPHLQAPLAHSPEQAAQALGDLVNEIDRRGDLLAGLGARDVIGYNKRAPHPLPFILCVIDESLDLVMLAGDKSDLAQSLKTIAIRGRSAGVYLWAATQHAAAVSGLPRVVNVNLTSRLVFRVADGSAAQAAGCPGAQSISRGCPGRLFARLDGKPQELQGYFVSDDLLAALAGSLGGGKRPVTLTEGERALVVYALQELDGAFIVGKLAAAFSGAGWTNHKIRQLAQHWQRRGWLTKPAHATDARRVTQSLCDLCDIASG